MNEYYFERNDPYKYIQSNLSSYMHLCNKVHKELRNN